MKYIFINHGYMGSNVENWFPWFKEQVDNDNTSCIILQYPIEKDKHFYDYWKKELDKYLEHINEDTIIIGHSSGCAFTIKYLLEKNIKINKLILVSGFNDYYSDDDNDFHNTVNKTFYVTDNELVKIKDLTNEIICIYGDNDPYIPQDVFKKLANKLDAKEVIIHNGGHLNLEAGYDKFEEILKCL